MNPNKSLLKSTSIVSLMTFISRILGFVRDALAAQIYGINGTVDAFNVAFKIPNFMRNLFAEGCFSQAFVPVLSEYRTTRSASDVKILISHVAGGLGLFLLLLTILGMLASPAIILLFAPGYHIDTPRYQWASEMLRITFPYILLISLTAFASSVLNSFKHFATPAITPALLNIVLIIAAVFFSHRFSVPIEAQAWGVLIAGFVQLSFLLIFMVKYKLFVWPRLSFKDPGVKRILKIMGPALFGASVGQLSLLLNTIFASFLAVGSISWLYYSDRLAFFPLGVFGVALATVVLPHLSSKHATKAPTDYAKALDWGIRLNLLIALPAMVCLMVIAGPLIISLFQYGHFSHFDTFMTRQSVLAYSFGLPAFMLVKVLCAAFYAQQQTKIAVKLGIYAILATMALNALLVFPLAHAGLALASSLGSWLNVVLLVIALSRRNILQKQPGWWCFILRLVVANALLALALYFLSGDIKTWFDTSWRWRLSHVAELGIVGLGIYGVSLGVMGMRFSDFKLNTD